MRVGGVVAVTVSPIHWPLWVRFLWLPVVDALWWLLFGEQQAERQADRVMSGDVSWVA